MTDDLVKFNLPASFVISRVVLRPSELAYGYVHGWLEDSSVVSIAEHELALGMDLPPTVLELALLLRDEHERVRDIIAEIEHGVTDDVADVWLYLVLAWVFDDQGAGGDPLSVVEEVYADFGYPEEIKGFVRFLPPPQGEPIGESALKARYARYLEDKSRHFARRSR